MEPGATLGSFSAGTTTTMVPLALSLYTLAISITNISTDISTEIGNTPAN
jgi:hypothetical protein